MDCFRLLPPEKRAYMELLFQNCTEEVKYYMSLTDIPAGQTFIQTGDPCTHIYVLLSGKVTGVEWPICEHPYPFKDFGPGDFFGEIEYFAGLPCYRISVYAATDCRVLTIPMDCYMAWMRMDVDALFLRTRENIHRLITQTAEARKYLFLDGKDRLMIHLIRLFEQQSPLPASLTLRQTRNQLADEIGFSIKTMNRSVGLLSEMGLIEVKKGKIVIPLEGYREMRRRMEQSING